MRLEFNSLEELKQFITDINLTDVKQKIKQEEIKETEAKEEQKKYAVDDLIKATAAYMAQTQNGEQIISELLNSLNAETLDNLDANNYAAYVEGLKGLGVVL